MHPTCYSLGPLTIRWYGVMMAVGCLSALAVWTMLGRRKGRDFAFCSDLLFWIMVAGILMSRVAHVAAEWESYAGHPLEMLRIDKGGLIYYGGVAGACLAVIVFARRRGQGVLALFDMVVVAVPLAHAFGRVGCFLNGCCHGTLSGNLPGVCFPAESLAWWQHVQAGLIPATTACSQPVHAVQLYEAAVNLGLFVLLLTAYRLHRRDGRVAAVYLLTYPVARYWLEFLRGDPRLHWMGLSIAQVVSLIMFAVGLVLWFLPRRGLHAADRST